MKKILTIFFILLTTSSAAQNNEKIIIWNEAGQREVIKKGERYNIIYGDANPENTRIRYIISDNPDEYILELVTFNESGSNDSITQENFNDAKNELELLKNENLELKEKLKESQEIIKQTESSEKSDKEEASDEKDQTAQDIGEEKPSVEHYSEEKITEMEDEVRGIAEEIDDNIRDIEQNQKNLNDIKDRISKESDIRELNIIKQELDSLISRNNILLNNNKDLLLRKNALEKDIEIQKILVESQKREIESRARERNLLIAAAVMILIIAVVLYVNIRIKMKHNAVLDLKNRGIYNPAEILSELNKEIRKVLHQRDDRKSQQDGMDMLIIRMNGNELTFAGARRPLWYMEKEGFKEIKGDRNSIGGRQKKKEVVFTNHKLTVHPGMTFYLTSDGFADQNNPENENYGTNRLKDYLIRISQHDLEKQSRDLEEELKKFSGGEKNRDDITIFGIKI